MNEYRKALCKYFSRLPPWERKLKGGVEKYMKYAEEAQIVWTDLTHAYVRALASRGVRVRVILNHQIEYNLPHTLENIIVLPVTAHAVSENILLHELTHIYVRTCRPNLDSFRAQLGLVRIQRKQFYGEITNPDTSGYEGLLDRDRIIFVALFHGKENYVSRYFTAYMGDSENIFGRIREASDDERNFYDRRLPYHQNYHSEEILAELVAKKISQINLNIFSQTSQYMLGNLV